MVVIIILIGKLKSDDLDPFSNARHTIVDNKEKIIARRSNLSTRRSNGMDLMKVANLSLDIKDTQDEQPHVHRHSMCSKRWCRHCYFNILLRHIFLVEVDPYVKPLSVPDLFRCSGGHNTWSQVGESRVKVRRRVFLEADLGWEHNVELVTVVSVASTYKNFTVGESECDGVVHASNRGRRELFETLA